MMPLPRVKFFRNNIGSTIYAERIKEILEQYNALDLSNINCVIEVFNIYRYSNTKAEVGQLNDDFMVRFAKEYKQIPCQIGRFCNTISTDTICDIYSGIESYYAEDFWELLDTYKVYDRIDAKSIKQLLSKHMEALLNVLYHRQFVKRYGLTIAECLSNTLQSAEWLIQTFLIARNSDRQFLFPDEFTQEMRRQVLNNYVESDDARANYLYILGQAQSTKEFPVADELKLKAQEKWEVLQEQKSKNGISIQYGVDISFQSIPDGSVKQYKENEIFHYEYSREWICENLDNATLLNNFIYLFNFVDLYFRCRFTSLQSDLSALERCIGLKAKKAYEIGMGFHYRDELTNAQMKLYLKELTRYDIRLETIFKWFFEEYLKTEFGAEGFSYIPPSAGTSYMEKCTLLSKSIDGILKQYRLFATNGCVNRKLLQISSAHIVFDTLQSLNRKKYAYCVSDDLYREMSALFSNQSMMSYTDKTQSQYESLFHLLTYEDMTIDDFQVYQLDTLQWLIKRGSIIEDNHGQLRLNCVRVQLLFDLFRNEVLCPQYFSDELQRELESMIAHGEIEYKDTLFSMPEQKYLNFMLNKSEYCNGPDIRNKYIHESISLDENEHFHDYIELLKIMVLIIIKINEEFCLRSNQDAQACKRELL